MIGVVVWSKQERQKAVIWCEDHAALAYLQGNENLLDRGRWPSVGDLLELDSEDIDGLRHARNVHLITEDRCADLPDLLLASAAPAGPNLRLVARQMPNPPHHQDDDGMLARAGAAR